MNYTNQRRFAVDALDFLGILCLVGIVLSIVMR